MITLTTVLAMLPLALGLGSGGAQMMQGLGITVIGGLMASTVLALLLLPTFYLIIDGNPEKREERKKKRSEMRDIKLLAIEAARTKQGQVKDTSEQESNLRQPDSEPEHNHVYTDPVLDIGHERPDSELELRDEHNDKAQSDEQNELQQLE